MTEYIHLGHCLTRHEAARRAGIPAMELALRPDLLRIRGHWLGEVYYAFQFNHRGIRPDLADVVRSLHDRFNDLVIADWLARPSDRLDGLSPIRWVETGGDLGRLNAAVALAGPVADTGEQPPAEARPATGDSGQTPEPLHKQTSARRSKRRVGEPRAGPTRAA
jgi:hypothetical protein